MNPQKPHLTFAAHQLEMAQIAYEHLLTRGGGRRWLHVGSGDSDLAAWVRRSARRMNIVWDVIKADDARSAADEAAHLFIDGNELPADVFAQLLSRLATRVEFSIVCGTGFHQSGAHRHSLLSVFPGRISLVASTVWWAQPEFPALPKQTRGAVLVPCFQDTWRVEQNLAWRPELVAGLDVHIFDDNFAPGEMDRLSAVARACGWHYHQSGLGEHEDFTARRMEFADYNWFIWKSLTSLADDYDFVVKVDTDACLLNPDWWHELAARLQGRDAMLGTFDLRPMYEVAYFWHVAWQNGYSPPVPAYPLHLQGGIYAISQGALLKFREMGFLPGPHHDFTEDGYMSYCAQLLGIEMLPATTIGAWTSLKRPPLDNISHLKAIHPLMQREWPVPVAT